MSCCQVVCTFVLYWVLCEYLKTYLPLLLPTFVSLPTLLTPLTPLHWYSKLHWLCVYKNVDKNDWITLPTTSNSRINSVFHFVRCTRCTCCTGRTCCCTYCCACCCSGSRRYQQSNGSIACGICQYSTWSTSSTTTTHDTTPDCSIEWSHHQWRRATIVSLARNNPSFAASFTRRSTDRRGIACYDT